MFTALENNKEINSYSIPTTTTGKGYVIFKNGLKIAWGVTAGTSQVTTTYGITFNYPPSVAVCTIQQDSGGWASACNITTTSFQRIGFWLNGTVVQNTGTSASRWLAVGY